jgi:hypothetical protein
VDTLDLRVRRTVFALGVGTGLAGSLGWTGAAERVLATTGAAGIVVLALAVRRKAPSGKGGRRS